jgi:hypothetical protein
MRGWIIDEDIQKFGDAGINKRREATFHSLQSSVRNFGTGISLALGLIYLVRMYWVLMTIRRSPRLESYSTALYLMPLMHWCMNSSMG